MLDYYDVMGVHKHASERDVQRAYKRLVFLSHPDKNKHPDAVAQTQLLNEAYWTLGDPIRRSQYDSSIARNEGYTETYQSTAGSNSPYTSGPWGWRRPDFSEPERPEKQSRSHHSSDDEFHDLRNSRGNSGSSHHIDSTPSFKEIFDLFRTEVLFWLLLIGIGVVAGLLGIEFVAMGVLIVVIVSVVASKWDWLPFHSYFAVLSYLSSIALGLGCFGLVVAVLVSVILSWIR